MKAWESRIGQRKRRSKKELEGGAKEKEIGGGSWLLKIERGRLEVDRYKDEGDG
jgi:hypothetical protein